MSLTLKDTFDFIHEIIQKQTQDNDNTGDSTISHKDEEVIDSYQYYNPIYYNPKYSGSKHVATLILLKDKIEYHEYSYHLDVANCEQCECSYSILNI